MIAEMTCVEEGYVAQMERYLTHSCEKVWAMLTVQTKLEQWFEELRIGNLSDSGYMRFYIEGVMDEKLAIIEFKPYSVLAFDWFGDEVSFRLQPKKDGCLLIFNEKINNITEQTKKDIAGWHVCLDVIQALLDGRVIEREKEWEKWYKKYAKMIDELC